jgi:hypothetical protein
MADTNNPKKRGRRKKVVENDVPAKCVSSSSSSSTTKKETKSVSLTQGKCMNVILNLHCTIEEIDNHIRQEQWKTNEMMYNPTIPKEIIPFYNAGREYHLVDNESENTQKTPSSSNPVTSSSSSSSLKNTELSEQDIVKIKELKLQYYKNEIPDKKIDCFWCTCPYDNDPCFILQHGSTGDINAHGSYCSPGCAVAFLFRNMQWDDSAKIDSYQLMNYYYNSKNYDHSIKPAASPYYFLDKYYGNLTIQEFRKMTNSNYMFLCIEKPVTRVLPEIHEETDRTTTVSNRGNYKVKKQSDKTGSTNRNDILKSNFGI